MAISEKEENEIRAKAREEVQKKEEERIAALESLKQMKKNVNFQQKEYDENQIDQLKKIEIAEDEKNKYYKEKGFIPVKDRSGNVYWLSKEEYEEKKHRIKSKHGSKTKGDLNIFDGKGEVKSNYIFIGLIFFILLGIVLTLIFSFINN